MSDTIVDMPKVTQMLDAGWGVLLRRCSMGTYTAIACKDLVVVQAWLEDDDADPDGIPGAVIITDDFTPEQALTRLAYKIFGEII